MPVKWNQEELMARLRPAMMRAVVRGTESIRTAAIRSIQSGTKTGRIYRRRGIIHQASAPGQPPASDTGRLVNSITTRYEIEQLKGTVQVGVEYGAFLEFGTSKMEPRPFMRPALMDSVRGIADAIRSEVTAALK